VAGEHRQTDAAQREGQPEQGPEILEQDHRQLGRLGVADERDPAGLAAHHVGFFDRGRE
jgi:hypothetical protein